MTNKIFLYFLGFGMIVLFAVSLQAQPKFIAALNSAQVVPPTTSAGRGVCTVTLTNEKVTNLACEYSGLSNNLYTAWVSTPGARESCGALVQGGQNGSFSLRCELPYGPSPPSLSSLLRKQVSVTFYSNLPFVPEIQGRLRVVTIDSDVDGEGRTEMSIFRPSEDASYSFCSINNSTLRQQIDWNSQTDSTPFLADLDGDGIADWTFLRTDPASGEMFTLFRSSRSGNGLLGTQFGNTNYGDMPVFGDYDRDGRIGVAVFRPSNGIWYILNDIQNPNQVLYEYWGTLGDTPCAGDYDGDGKTDLCVVRAEDGHLVWYIRRSTDQSMYVAHWGLTTDTIYPRDPVDVDRDGVNDIMVSRIENGLRVFYALRSSDSSLLSLQWGLERDAVKFGDYDNDGRSDFAAIREIDGRLAWFIHQSSDGQTRVAYWGLPGDR